MMARKHQHRQIHASGDPVAAGDIVRERSFLQDHGQHEFGSEQQNQGEQPCAEARGHGRWDGEAPDHEPGGDQDDDEHEWHLAQFRHALAQARHKKGDAKRPQHEAGTKLNRPGFPGGSLV